MEFKCTLQTIDPVRLFDICLAKKDGRTLGVYSGLHFEEGKNSRICNVYFGAGAKIEYTPNGDVYTDSLVMLNYNPFYKLWLATITVNAPSADRLFEFINNQHGMETIISVDVAERQLG